MSLSMDTTSTQIASGTILFLLLLFFPYLSIADVIYSPVELFSINCGSSSNLSTRDGRNWTADIKFLSENKDSVAAPALTPSTLEGPYTDARLSRSQFTYSFPVSTGPKFLRLFFYSTSYQNFHRSKAYFSVKAGPYTLLQNFNASLHADAGNEPGDYLFREYCINLKDGDPLNITFIASKTSQNPDSYAFINGIEIVSMPPFLYYTNPDDVDITGLPHLVGVNTNLFPIENNFTLETKYRLRVGDQEIPVSQDTGMLRSWDVDNKYVTTQSVLSLDIGPGIKLRFTKIPNYTAPDTVYRSVRNMGNNGTINMGFNLTWQLPIDSGFTYLLRLHFCQLNPDMKNPGYQSFFIFVQDQLVEMWADILGWSDKQEGVPVVKQYVVFIPGNQQETLNLSLKMHPNPQSLAKDAQINAIELFKINDATGSLAGPNPDPDRLPETPKVPLQRPNNKSSGTTRTLAAAGAGAVSAAVLLSFIVAFFLIKRKKKMGSKEKDETPLGGGLSSLPTNLCRHFSIAEIRAATNNFDEHFVVGMGGFGNVYKGYIDDGSTRVAIKRLKPDSRQGAQEFMNEIEMLSQLRHLHLVSLVGYCYESKEMILVYDFMDRGTLREHLYDTDNPSLSWKQRLQICVGAARGLHYLHTGAKHTIIHRDVKSTNILLDEKWVAKVSDFGLSRIGPISSSMTHVSTQVKGSVGYIDPEYYKRQRLTEKSDVYSFGVVLLEVLSGRQPLLRWEEKQRISLVNWAKHCNEKGTLSEIVDAKLKGQIAPQCLQRYGEVALSCLLEDGTQRPSMNDVVRMLEFVLHLQEGAVNEVTESEDTEDVFSSSHSSLLFSDYSKSTALSMATNVGDCSYGSKDSEERGENRLLGTTTFNILEELCTHFSLAEIKSAVRNIKKPSVIGEDSFGVVYKGYLKKGATTVAIKWFRKGSLSGLSESQLKNEVLFLCQLHHPNIMPLIGFCIERDHPHLILVHEYMLNGALSDHLHPKSNHKVDPLPWKRRLQICIGVARGLHYLHTGGKCSVIHNFFKTCYILLDQIWEPKISGLLLSKRGSIDVANSSLVARNHDTFAYCDPEYLATGILTVKSNVFSFGVVLLEVVSAKQGKDLFLERNRLMNDEPNYSLELQTEKIVDPFIKSRIAPDCWKAFVDITERCLHKQGMERPNMGEVSEIGKMFIKYLSFCCSKHTSSSQRQYPTVIEELRHQFLLADLRKSTNNFDENQIVGSGALSIFKNEIELLCQLRHPNLVHLLGFCNDREKKITVYEYMANGSLHDCLYYSDKQRLKICIGAARGLHYLHTGTKRTIFHRDVTPYNILLDSNMVAKLTDFRLSLTGPHYASKPKPKTISKDGFLGIYFSFAVSTYGYVAPEISENNTLTEKCDVYSFGVVLLEVICKDKLKDVEKRQKHPVEENIDPNLKGKIAPECWEVFMDITERCLKFDPNERPAMGEVEVQLELALSLQEEADIRNTLRFYGPKDKKIVISKIGIMLIKYLGFCWSKHASSCQRQYPTVIEELCHQFSLADIKESTKKFDEDQIIGTGDFCIVYKGFLQNNGVTDDTVVIKRIRGSGEKELKQFKNEIELLCQLRHPNLITLLGFCVHKDEKIVVYEHMANGSLHDRLYCSDVKKEPLTWKHRLKICIGAAHGLHYLHTGAKRTIFHRDITPYKILLDRNMVAKLADFRLSLKGPHYASKPKPKTISKDGFIANGSLHNCLNCSDMKMESLLWVSEIGKMFIKYLSFCCSKHTSSSQRQYPTVIEELCHQFLLADLRKSTNNFDENQIVGSGVLSIVYKGSLQLNGVTECTVAMKRICGNTEETLKQFKNEIELLCQLRHPNLMTLLGFCDHKDEKIVVYEYMANGSLHDRLYCSDVKKEPLTWKHRLKICIGAAHGLHYLHTGAKRTIFHRDITPYKILLDRNMVAKLSDFRLSLKGPHYASKPKPKTISKDGFIGTCGYVAPEISENKTLTEKCDVYSFGVVLLEVVCKDKLKNVDKRQKHPVEENIDPNIKGKIAPECWEVFIDITERCLKFDPDERPAMGKVEVQLELALSLQEEAGMRNSCDDYTLLSMTIIN
ncbi:Receptor-like protein kinase FERONIA [Glycine soja]